jgi:hypothetical protein
MVYISEKERTSAKWACEDLLKHKMFMFLKEKINYMIVGGYAVNFHEYSKNTVDIDLIIKFPLAHLKKMEK